MISRSRRSIDQCLSDPTAARKPRTPRDADADTRALEKQLSDVLGLTVSLRHDGQAGEIRIRYGSLEQLDELCRRLSAG